MNFEMDRDDGNDGEPSLKEMTRKAVQILNRSPEGFLLMVEGNIRRVLIIRKAKLASINTPLKPVIVFNFPACNKANNYFLFKALS